MADAKTYHWMALATGIGASATVSAFLPGADWLLLGVTGLAGYAGGLLPDIDDEKSLHYRIVRRLSMLAAVIVSGIQFFYRPADLLLAMPLALFMLSQVWTLLGYCIKQGGYTHSVLAAVCLSLGVAWVAYLTAGTPAIIPAFLASGSGYLLHLLLDDLGRSASADSQPTHAIPALAMFGKGKSVELYSILTVGLLCGLALWGL